MARERMIFLASLITFLTAVTLNPGVIFYLKVFMLLPNLCCPFIAATFDLSTFTATLSCRLVRTSPMRATVTTLLLKYFCIGLFYLFKN